MKWVDPAKRGTIERRGESMKIVVQAVFENGVFRPLGPVENLQEHGAVLLTIVPAPGPLGDRQSAKATMGADTGLNLGEPGVTPELLQEVRNSIQVAISNVRDPEVMRQAAERTVRHFAGRPVDGTVHLLKVRLHRTLA